jgi:uncharacterized membrane protein
MAALTPPDWIALAVFLLCWIAYAVVTDRVQAIRARSVIAAMDEPPAALDGRDAGA